MILIIAVGVEAVLCLGILLPEVIHAIKPPKKNPRKINKLPREEVPPVVIILTDGNKAKQKSYL